MLRHRSVGFVPAVALLVLALCPALPAQEETKTTSEKVKEKASGAVDSVKRGVGSAGEAIKNKFQQARGAVAAMGIEARVYSRLHWDKALTASRIDLSAPRQGVIVLSGTVPDAVARARAISLTNDTVGVTEVVDHLTVGPATTTPEPAPASP